MDTQLKRTTEIKKLLRMKIGGERWKISQPEQGLSKETYIVNNDRNTYFLKFDVNISPLQRLSDLELTPKVLVTGILHNKNYVIQEFISGNHPDRVWFESNIERLAEFIVKYHNDEQLSALLSEKNKFNLQNQILGDITNLEKQITRVNEDQYKTQKFVNYYKRFIKQSKLIPNTSPKVIHADPNQNNIIVTDSNIYMVDWDIIILSDPLRDIGLILWWYLKKEHWLNVFKRFGLADNQETYHRLYWWVAARSLTISLWFLINKNSVKDSLTYLKDFYYAVDKKENPFFNG